MSKNYSLYGLPESVEFCKKCVISNQRPSSVIRIKNKNNSKNGIAETKKEFVKKCEYNDIKNKIDWNKKESN